MDLQLEVIQGLKGRAPIRLELGRVLTLGRQVPAESRLDHFAVQRSPVQVGRDEGGAWVRDLNSRSGLYINQWLQPRDQIVRLRLDDVFDVGPVFLRLGGVFEFPADWLRWQGQVLRHLAAEVKHGNWSALPALADALEELGCTDAELLADCRESHERFRGSWLADSITRQADALLGPLEERQP